MRFRGTLALLLASAPGLVAQAPNPGWVPIRFIRTRPPADSQAWNPDTIVFQNGHRLTAELWAVEYVGQLPRGTHPPYLVIAAMGCYDCDDMTSIYLAWPGHGHLDHDSKSYEYPGTITPEQSDTATFRSRMFIGTCLDDGKVGLTWFQEERDSTGKWVHEVYRVRVQADTIERGFLRGALPPLNATLERVKGGQCREITPRDQVEY